MDEESRVGLLQSFECEVYSALEELRRLELKIVFSGVPEDLNVVGHSQVPVIEFDLHIDDVGNALIHNFDHLEVIPNTSPNRNAVGDPRHVHG